jgi:Na+/proline symporter
LQFFVYMAGGIVILLVICGRLPGGAGQVWDFAISTERLRVFDFRWSDPGHLTFWPGLLGGAFLSLATHGADQLIVQRYLCARDQRSASLALGWSGPIVLLQFTLFLVIGVAIACYFTEFDPTRFLVDGQPIKGDEALLSFVAKDLYPGLTGLVLAAICAAAMSTLSSSVNSSASSLLDDLFAGWTTRQSDAASLWAARLMTLVFTALQAAIALGAEYAIRDQSVVDQVLAIAGFAAGLLLGLYFLGLLVGKAPTWIAVVSLVAGASVNLWVTYLAWNTYWFSFTGSLATLACGLLLVFSTRAMTRPGLER